MSMARILIVDDEPRICDSLMSLFKTNNYDVMTANCGRDATEIFGNGIVDVTILNIHLPDMMGTQLLGDIKVQRPDTIVIIITGDAELNTALTALKNGAYAYLRKPFEFDELLNTVENALYQKNLKQEKDKINNQLYLSEKKYRYLVQNSPDVIYSLDTNGKFTFLSDAVKDMLGYSADDLIGKHYSAIISEEDRVKAKCLFDERRSKHRASSGIELELTKHDPFKGIGENTQTVSVELKSTGIYEKSTTDGEQKFIGTHGVIRDTSERQRFQDQLRNAERMESLGTLAGGIAHDFNNLLMGIQGRTTLVSMDLDQNDPHLEHLQSVEEYIRSAKTLTNQLLGLARRGKYEVKPTNINELILKSVRMFSRTKKELIIETKFRHVNIIVEADRGQIEQALLNLYVNAWQAMPDGGTLHIETEITELNDRTCRLFQLKPGRYVHISVKDSGVGMNPQTLQQIFDPFFTTKEKGRGTGLGLASVYGIIKNHNGAIQAVSRVGCGATFNIYLPISDKKAVLDEREEEKIHKGSETILLVDDEQLVIDVGKALLEKMGYHVMVAQNGEEAVRKVRKYGPAIDLIILDMIMPGMDGSKIFDHIRDIQSEIPVLLSSGYALNAQAENIMSKGCSGFIQKPFTIAEVSGKVREILIHQ
jgi:two-component system cell cycle sensor histidine kinase/response regulator CckA